ncbi:MAG: hypothetical protein ACW99J_20695 [Candidatus Thorarchaeota archaeon]
MKRPNFVRMDKREIEGIDIVHDLEVFPYPLEDEVFIDVMDELWRVSKLDAQLAISMPYGYSDGFLQDPTHCNACNHGTWEYFDPRCPLYSIYKPKPWLIQDGFPTYKYNGNMEVLLRKAANDVP